jgi:hypothetical protein
LFVIIDIVIFAFFLPLIISAKLSIVIVVMVNTVIMMLLLVMLWRYQQRLGANSRPEGPWQCDALPHASWSL